MDDDDRPGMDPALFDRLWDELHQHTYYMGMRVIPFDAQAARRERFIPLKLLFFWLDKLPHPRGCVPDLGLLGLAQFHIRIGHLKTYGPSWRSIPTMIERDPETVEVIKNGKVIEEARVAVWTHTETEEPDNPLIDIHDFATWFREVCPEYLRLPAGFPGAAGEAAAGELSDTTARGAELDPGAADPPEAAGDDGPEPACLIFKELAEAFKDLHGWDEKKWLNNMRSGTADWINKAIRRAGKQGRGLPSFVHPVTLAMSLIDFEARLGTNVAALIRELDQRFEQPPLLAWRAIWRRERGRL